MDITCILCPNGCPLNVDYDKEGNVKITGNKCIRGENFAKEEIACSKRSLTSTVKTTFKKAPRLPVKSDKDIPIQEIFNVMKEINKVVLDRKVKVNDIIIMNVCNLGVNIISASDTDYLLGD